MAIPSVVTDAAAKGNEMLDRFKKEAEAPVTEPVVIEPVVAPPVSLETPAPVVAPSPAPSIDKEEIDKLVRQRMAEYENTSAGRLKVTAEENRALKSQMQTLENELKALRERPAVPAIPSADIATRRAELALRDGEESETVKAFDRDVASQLQIAQLTEQIQGLKSDLSGIQTHAIENDRTKYTSALDTTVPKWKEHINDDRYLPFLQTKAPYTSKTFLELAQEADQRCDANASSEILQTFEKFITPNGTPPPVTPPANGKESLIVPDTKPGVKPDVSEKVKKIYSLAEANKLKNEITSGRFKGTPEEKQDLMNAGFEGRIR